MVMRINYLLPKAFKNRPRLLMINTLAKKCQNGQDKRVLNLTDCTDFLGSDLSQQYSGTLAGLCG